MRLGERAPSQPRPPTLWRAVIPGRGSDSSVRPCRSATSCSATCERAGASNGRRTAQREHKLPPRGRDAPLDLWRGKSGHPTDPARAFGHGLGEPCGVATCSSSGGCRPSNGRPRRHRCRAPYARRTPRTPSWPCTRTLGIGENPSAVGTDSSRHAETLLILSLARCKHRLDTQNPRDWFSAHGAKPYFSDASRDGFVIIRAKLRDRETKDR